MIFTVERSYRLCLACHTQVPFAPHACPVCQEPFPVESTRLIAQVVAECQRRVAQPGDPSRVRYSKLYRAFGAYHHLYAIPLFSVEELLIVEHLMSSGQWHTSAPAQEWWVASFRPAQQPADRRTMTLLSWSPLLWDEDGQIFCVGEDEGPRVVDYTIFE